MPGPFDTTTKYLVQTYPRDWLDRLGLATTARLDLLDADLATVNPLADKVIRVDEPAPWLAHLEFQSTYDATMGQRLAEYNLSTHVPRRSTSAETWASLAKKIFAPVVAAAARGSAYSRTKTARRS